MKSMEEAATINNSLESPPPPAASESDSESSLGFATTFPSSIMEHNCGESYSTTTAESTFTTTSSATTGSSMSEADLLIISPSPPPPSLFDSTENNSESDETLKAMLKGGGEVVDNSNANIYSFSHCPFDWDGILCWPKTLVGETATLPCMETLHGIPYNTSSKSHYYTFVWFKSHLKSLLLLIHTGYISNNSLLLHPLQLAQKQTTWGLNCLREKLFFHVLPSQTQNSPSLSLFTFKLINHPDRFSLHFSKRLYMYLTRGIICIIMYSLIY